MGFAFTVVKVFLIDVLLLFLCIIRPWLVFQSRAAEGNGGGTPLLRMIQMVRADFVLQHVRHGACQCPPFREGLHPEHQRQWVGFLSHDASLGFSLAFCLEVPGLGPPRVMPDPDDNLACEGAFRTAW